MKWITGLDREDERIVRMYRLSNWHPWFAWHPVCVAKLEDGRQVKMWLSIVQRKGAYDWGRSGDIWRWRWEYKEMK